MIKVIKQEEIVCDCCETPLFDNGVRTNSGKFEEPFLRKDDVDLCYICAGKIFYREVVRKVPTDTLKEWITSLRKSESSNPLGSDLELVLPEIDMTKTTGVNDSPIISDVNGIMFQDDHNDLVQITKSTSSLDQVKSLEEL